MKTAFSSILLAALLSLGHSAYGSNTETAPQKASPEASTDASTDALVPRIPLTGHLEKVAEVICGVVTDKACTSTLTPEDLKKANMDASALGQTQKECVKVFSAATSGLGAQIQVSQAASQQCLEALKKHLQDKSQCKDKMSSIPSIEVCAPQKLL